MAREPRVLAIDAGGTMTDTFIVDRAGEFVVGKAQTTPADESVGFMASTRDALAYWDMDAEDALPPMVSGIYSGTAMLNRLLERKGRRVGLIVTAGHGGRRCGSSAASRPISAIRTRTACTSPRTTTTSRSCRASGSGACAAGSTCSATRRSRSTRPRRARRSRSSPTPASRGSSSTCSTATATRRTSSA